MKRISTREAARRAGFTTSEQRQYNQYWKDEIRAGLEPRNPDRVEAGFRDPSTGRIWGTGVIHSPEHLPSDAKYHAGLQDILINPSGTKWRLRESDTWLPIRTGKLQSRQYGARRSSAGGDVQVSAYEREGHPVSSYTRSKPSRSK